MSEPAGQFTKFELNKVTVHAEGWGRGFLRSHWEDAIAETEERMRDLSEPRLGPDRYALAKINEAKREEERKAFWGVRYGLPGLGLSKMLHGCDCEEW